MVVSNVTSAGYTLSFYENGAYDPTPDGGTGLYTVTGSPKVVYVISDESAGSDDVLRLTRTEGLEESTLDFINDPVAETWERVAVTDDGSKTAILNYENGSGDRVQERIKADASDNVIEHIRNVYHEFAWGEELITVVTDPDGEAATRSIEYYTSTSTDGDNYRQRKSVTYPDGRWEKYLEYDEFGQLRQKLTPWKDQALSTATTSNSLLTVYVYGTDENVFRIVEEREELNGEVMKKTTYAHSLEEVSGDDVLRVEVRSEHTAEPAEYKTITKTWVDQEADYTEVPEHKRGKTYSVQERDGRMAEYDYETGTISYDGGGFASGFSTGAGVDIRRTVTYGKASSLGSTSATLVNVSGESTREVSLETEDGRTVRRQTLVYDGSGYSTVIESELSLYDEDGNVLATKRNGKVVYEAEYDANGELESETDEAGVETAHTTGLPAGDREYEKPGPGGGTLTVATATVYDNDLKLVTESRSDGTTTLEAESVYDLLGRLVETTGEDGLTTTVGYTNAGRTETVTRPGGATEITDRYLDGRLKSITGTGVVHRTFDYGVDNDGNRWTKEYLGPDGTSSPRWTKTTYDWVGRVLKEERPGWASGGGAGADQVTSYVYNAKAQLWKQSRPGMTGQTVYTYSDLGQPTGTGLLVGSTTTREERRETTYAVESSTWYRQTVVKRSNPSGGGVYTFSTTQEQLGELGSGELSKTVSTDVYGTVRTTTVKVNGSHQIETETVTTGFPSGKTAKTVAFDGYVLSATTPESTGTTIYDYDDLGRVLSIDDPVSGETTMTYTTTVPLSQVATTTDEGNHTTTRAYDAATGRLKSVTDAESRVTYFGYSTRGEQTRVWGTATYPLEYVYDDYGQLENLKTFRGGSSWGSTTWPGGSETADTTTWVYHEPTGLLNAKQDAATESVVYAYTAAGQLSKRTWARGIETDYAYDPDTGDLTDITYSDSTLDVKLAAYNDRGEPATVQMKDGSTVVTEYALQYGPDGRPTSETFGDFAVTRTYSGTLGGMDSLEVESSASGHTFAVAHGYVYDTYGRLQNVKLGSPSSGELIATYGYRADNGLPESLALQKSGTTRLTTTRTYDALGRLQKITNTPSAASILSYDHHYTATGRRDKITLADSTWWQYQYNPRGEVTAGKRHVSSAEYLPGYQFEYDFDNVGNRTTAERGGDGHGAGLRLSSFTPNALNQIASRTVPGAFDVLGSASESAAVTVNNAPTERRGGWWAAEVEVDNDTSPVLEAVTIVGVKNNVGSNGEDAVTEETGSVYVPQTPESFSYDDDGNLLGDGRWAYTWDAENRLIAMEAISAVPAAGKRKLEFAYDYRGRRISKKVYDWGGSSYSLASTTSFLYDGWNLVAELDDDGDILRSYIRGNDLSGSAQGAGGVGGLIMVSTVASGDHFAAYDGNGNVMGLVNAADGNVSANYEYGPFGEPLRASGTMAAANPIRWSTKYGDGETGLVYYGYRCYNPETGRWVSRDPIGENGGDNLYGFAFNNGINYYDESGLQISVDQLIAMTKAKKITGDEDIATLRAWREQFLKNNGLKGYPTAERHLRHWFGATGNTIQASSENLKAQNAVQFGVSKIMIHFISSKDETTLGNKTICEWAKEKIKTSGSSIDVPKDVWFNTLVEFSNPSDWFYASGTATLFGINENLKVSCSKKEDKMILIVKGKINLHFYDFYNWDRGKYTTFPNGMSVHDNAFGKIKNDGGGADFDIRSDWQKDIEFKCPN